MMNQEIENLPMQLELQDTEWPCTGITHDRQTARAIVYDEHGSLYFVKVSRDDDFGKAVLIETSGGGIEPGETPEQGILRELEEELGVKAVIEQKLAVVSDYYNLIGRHNINHFFLCRVLDFTPRHLTQMEEEDFHLEVLKVSYPQALRLYKDNLDTPLGRLIYNREMPVVKKAGRILNPAGHKKSFE